jgi:hypothetical protein
MVAGKAEHNGDALRILVSEVYPIAEARERFARQVVLSIDLDRLRSEMVEDLRKIVERHRGKCACTFEVTSGGQPSAMRLHSTRYDVKVSDEFVQEVERILGPNTVVISN